MAAILEAVTQSGLTIYGTIHDLNGNLANGSATEVYNGSNWSTYVNTVSEQGTSGYYKGSFPAYLGAGKYTIVLYQQAGGAPALGDPTVGSGQIYWNGLGEEQGIAAVLATAVLNLSGSSVGTVNNLGPTALSSVLAQIRTAITGDLIPQLTGAPNAMPTLSSAIMLLYMSLRNNHTSTSSTEKIYNDAGVVITSASLSDDGVTYSKGRLQ